MKNKFELYRISFIGTATAVLLFWCGWQAAVLSGYKQEYGVIQKVEDGTVYVKDDSGDVKKISIEDQKVANYAIEHEGKRVLLRIWKPFFSSKAKLLKIETEKSQ